MAYGLYNPSIDYNKAKFWLAKPNKQIIARLKEIDDTAKFKVEFGKVNQVDFTIPYKREKDNVTITNPNLAKIRAKYLLKMTFMGQTEWFVIENFSKEVADSDSIPVTAFSLQQELSHKKIYEIEETSLQPQAILNIVLDKLSWKVGTIDSMLLEKYRSFSFSNMSVLDCIYNIAETYNGILQFDTVEQTISLYHEDTISEFNGLVLNDKNYLKSLTDERNGADIVTRLYPIGSEGLTINSVNPTGSSYIEDFSYYMYPFQRDEKTKETIKSSFYFSDSLAHSMLDYQELIEDMSDALETLNNSKVALQTELTTIQNTLKAKQNALDIVNDLVYIMKANKEYTSKSVTAAFKEDIDLRADDHYIQMRAISGTAKLIFDGTEYTLSTSWTSFHKNYAADKKVSVEVKDITGSGVQFYEARIPPTEKEWETAKLQERYNPFILIDQIAIQQGLETAKKTEIAAIDTQLLVKHEIIALENNFTPEQIEERERYIHEEYWIEENHVNAQELYDDAKEQMKTINKPSTTMSVDIINFLSMAGEVRNWNKLKEGSKIRVYYSRLGIESESILTGIDYDFESQSISLSISDTTDLMTDEERLVKMIYSTSSSASSLALKKFIYDDASRKANAVTDLLNETWDATLRRIVAGTNESVEVGKRGIVIRNPNYPDHILVAQAGVLAISHDNGLSFKNALTTEGLIAERVVG